jgi:hypothetical protein
METFYETYKFLLLELSYDETIKRMDEPKFKRSATGKDSIEDMDPSQKRAYESLKSTIEKSIPHDIPENDKANALNWIITRLVKDNPDYPENRYFITGHVARPDKLKRQLELFYQIKQQKMDRLLPKKAIEQYSNFNEFIKSIERVAPSYREYLAQKQEKSTKGEGQLLVHEDDNWLVYFPRTKGAACSLGKGTDWCTAAPGLDYYSEYAKEGQLIIFISKKDPTVKYQLHYASKQYMDKNDNHIGSKVNILNKILNDNIIGSEFEKYLSEDERKEIINLATKTSAFKMIDDNYMVVEGEEDDEEEGTVYSKYIASNETLEDANPYSPTYSISKIFYDEEGVPLYSSELDEAVRCVYYYDMNVDHPDNLKKMSQLMAVFDFDPESGREKLIRFEIFKRGGGVDKYPPEKAAEFARYMTLGIE